MKKLSIVILNHNTSKILKDCLKSLEKARNELDFDVIVSDNDSSDDSVDMVKNNFSLVNILQGPNISFSNGNNRARKYIKTKYVLFLNSDTIVHKNTLKECVNYLENHEDVGALTCKLILPDGTLDKDARRKFPTPWISFKRLFLRNSKEYWYEESDENKTHEVDAIQGAFFLTKKEILDKVGWFDEKYKFDGEDLDLCFQIKKVGYKIIYYPEASITHLKKATKNIGHTHFFLTYKTLLDTY